MNAVWNPESQPLNPKFELFHLVGESRIVRDQQIQRSHLLDCEVVERVFEKVQFVSLNCMNTEFTNVRVIESMFHTGEFTCCRFRGAYFHRVVFEDCSFRDVRFENCIFDQCQFSEGDFEGLLASGSFERCVFLHGGFSRAQGQRLEGLGCLIQTQVPAVTPPIVSESKVEIRPGGKAPDSVPLESLESRFAQIEKNP